MPEWSVALDRASAWCVVAYYTDAKLDNLLAPHHASVAIANTLGHTTTSISEHSPNLETGWS